MSFSSTRIRLTAVHAANIFSPTVFSRLVQAGAFARPLREWRSEEVMAAGLPVEQVSSSLSLLAALNEHQAQLDLEKYVSMVVLQRDDHYPPWLAEIPSPPPVLYVRGTVAALGNTSLAVVGTRQPTSYGLEATRRLIEPVARAGLTIVSGLALGIDAAAHQAALTADGTTIAVLGCGLDRVYPWQHQGLAKDIVRHGGAIISEFPLGAEPLRHHFPQRNRIISGLSRAVLLIEAGEKSGALITAKFAVDQNRDVLIVPGPITSPQSNGPLNWLKVGATPVTSAEDILRHFELSTVSRQPRDIMPAIDDADQQKIVDSLRHGPRDIDALVETCRLDSSVIAAALSFLEIRGLVSHDDGATYRLTPPTG